MGESSTSSGLGATPTFAEDTKRRANMLLSAGDYRGAEQLVRPLMPKFPKDPEIQVILGTVAERIGNKRAALARYVHAETLSPGNPLLLTLIARMQRALNQYDASHATVDRLLTAHPHYGSGVLQKAMLLREQNRLDEAERLLDAELKASPDDPRIAIAFAGIAGEVGRVGEAIDACRAVLDNPQAGGDERRDALFALGKLYDVEKDWDAAFDAYSRANHILPAGEADVAENFTLAWTREVVERFPRPELPGGTGGREAVFVVGMPRSGTTLTEQVLASHPKLRTVGEDAALSYLTRGAGAHALTAQDMASIGAGYLDHILPKPKPGAKDKRGRPKKPPRKPDGVINKMPDNYRFLGVIQCSLPDARIIHCVRDPVDVCLSNFFQNFGFDHPWTRRLETCAAQMKFHDALMAHWREVLDLEIKTSKLEELTASPEERVTELCTALGLEFDPRCLEFHKSSRTVSTASTQQVRRGITHNPEPRWKRYEKHLGPLMETIGM